MAMVSLFTIDQDSERQAAIRRDENTNANDDVERSEESRKGGRRMEIAEADSFEHDHRKLEGIDQRPVLDPPVEERAEPQNRRDQQEDLAELLDYQTAADRAVGCIDDKGEGK